MKRAKYLCEQKRRYTIGGCTYGVFCVGHCALPPNFTSLLKPQKVALFGNRIFAVVIKTRSYWIGAYPVTQIVKSMPVMQETRLQSLEKGTATHSSVLAGRIPWTEEPVGYSPWDCKESDKTEQLRLHFILDQGRP